MMAPSSKFLSEEPPIVVSRSLVKVFGLYEGHLLQHIHHWLHLKAQDPLRYKNHFVEGRYWIVWTMAELQQQVLFGPGPTDQYKRVIDKLREQGVLLVEKHGEPELRDDGISAGHAILSGPRPGMPWDQNWYSLDYSELSLVIGASAIAESADANAIAGATVPTPPLHERRPRSSKRGQAVDHDQSAVAAQESTTTKHEAAEAESPDASGEDALALDLTRIPKLLWSEVGALLASRPDGQRFADLLSATLVRSAVLPEARRIQSPILWLTNLLANPADVDFSASDIVAAQREATATQQRLALESHAKEVAEAEARRVNELLHAEAAQLAIAAMSQSDREALLRVALKRDPEWTLPLLPKGDVQRSIAAGKLPKDPAARVTVLKALAKMNSPIAKDGATP